MFIILLIKWTSTLTTGSEKHRERVHTLGVWTLDGTWLVTLSYCDVTVTLFGAEIIHLTFATSRQIAIRFHSGTCFHCPDETAKKCWLWWTITISRQIRCRTSCWALPFSGAVKLAFIEMCNTTQHQRVLSSTHHITTSLTGTESNGE